MLGPSGVDGLVIATGHHRNGILLTPLTADVVSAYVLTGRLREELRPFTPERFSDNNPQRTASADRIVAAGSR
jgi:glycine oxidase